MSDDKVKMWCPYCREHHKDESELAVQDFIHNICKPEHDEE